MIKVLVVDDSPVVRDFLTHILSADPDIRVVGTACNGLESLEAAHRYRPDVITMDIHMPKMDGLEATRQIMETHPIPIVIVSGDFDSEHVAMTFDAMAAGALAVMNRPMGIGHPDHRETVSKLVNTVKLMSEVKVVRRMPRVPQADSVPRSAEMGLAYAPAQVRIVAIGASTGGPPVIKTILQSLSGEFPVPLVIVQHMSTGFIHGFAEWLAQSSGRPVHVATDHELMLPGHVYLAPDERQMKVERGGKIVLTQDEPENGLRPAVSCLFRSVAEVYGHDAVAVLLTGMGRDGADALRLLKEKGSVTIAQDMASSVVHGMPGEAIKLDAAMMVLPPEKIGAVLVNLANHRGKTGGTQ